MRLTQYSDFALRVLMYAAAKPEKLLTIEETARAYGISRAHLMKVVNQLIREGFLSSVRGRSGGFRLGRDPKDIRIGEVIRATEPDFAIVECFGCDNQCVITPSCGLKKLLAEALKAFLAKLDQATLKDMLLDRSMVAELDAMRDNSAASPSI
ncbi:Rrf2 family transcriptional regulator (plasmid) [Aliirhizobium terrae]|uniref:Rrf2 family transcriptional regulator n=1 Tax=Terrirhizobium terrae TaxID=2926709 RepID=UPI002575D69E|nr:Rrf2 family transcriptional regulator [Rhizobium sp. CC-CFT758]WJH37960.1 Rrf2 family transcriptional regulator [Rhizobium sp. CC-CFT758]